MGKLRLHQGKGLTQGHIADLVRAWNQSLPKPPNTSFFPLQSIAGQQQTGTKEESEGQAGKRMGTSLAWCRKRPASDKLSKLS